MVAWEDVGLKMGFWIEVKSFFLLLLVSTVWMMRVLVAVCLFVTGETLLERGC